MTLKALIFDIDGTVADTESDGHLVAFNKAFAAQGLDWFWDKTLYKKLLDITGGKERIKYYIDNYVKDFKSDNLINFIDTLHKLKTKYFIDIVNNGEISLRTGVRRLLLEAKKCNLILAIATTTSIANVEALLTHTLGAYSLKYFAVIATGESVVNKKPASDVYDYVLAKLNLDASECLAFEDSENGIIAASGAGIKSIITTNIWTDNHNFADALITLDSLGEPNEPFVIQNSPLTSLGYFVNVAMLKEIHINAKL